MPVSVKTDPFQAVAKLTLSKSQLNVLRVLMPDDPTSFWTEWPVWNRAQLRVQLGYRPTHTMNRLLNGQEDKDNRPGLITLGLVEVVTLYVEDIPEANLRITQKGIQCLCHHDKK